MKIEVKENGELLDYLSKHTDLSHKNLKKYLTNGLIYVNGTRTTKYNYPLKKGSVIIIETKKKNQESLPFDILFEDENIIVINKPSGLLSIATNKEKEETCYHKVREYLKTKNKNAKVFIIHRLDKDTSGVLMLAKNEHTKNMYQKNWDEYVKERSYIAIVHGKMEEKKKKLIYLLKETKTNLVYISKNKEGKKAITNYEVLKENDNYSKLYITIETGRKNQIRVSLAHINHPILGDKKYGEDKESRLYLHANKLVVFNPIQKKIMTFESKEPKEFNSKIK